MRSIHERPFPPEDRAEAGHWEGDLIIGKDQQSAIGTLVERQTRLVRLLHLPQRDSDTLHDALEARLGALPPRLRRSIAWDQGTEMARRLTVTATLGAPVYFCDSRSPWQRGSNENTNGLLRDYFPRAPTCAFTPPSTCSQSRTSSTTAPDVSSRTGHQPPSSTHCYGRRINPCCDDDWKSPRHNRAVFARHQAALPGFLHRYSNHRRHHAL